MDLDRAREIIRSEAEALSHAAEQLDGHFLEVVDAIQDVRGKVVVTGVGKSGIIGKKIATTLSSTGTPALFLHSLEGVMGDLGILSRDDILIAISNSGETSEVVNVVVAAGNIGTPAVAMTRNPESTLARECRYLLPIVVDGEAGSLGLAPTTSTTVTLVLGDALALVLKERKGFTPDQFARFHPGGSLGRRLSLKVRDIMRTGDLLPVVSAGAPLQEAVGVMSQGAHVEGSRFESRQPGVALVTNDDGRMVGILTDGDLRRLLARGLTAEQLASEPTARHMTADPMTVSDDALASEALRIMEVREITVLPIVGGRGEPRGLVHLHDILGKGKLIL